MTSNQLRQEFLDFFRSKKHHIVPSAPMVLKNDPTLMFTNAGMNPFKDFFLGIVNLNIHELPIHKNACGFRENTMTLKK